SSPSFSRQAKRASGGTALGSYPNALCFTYSVVLSPHFRALDWILSFSLAVTRTAIRTSFPIHISPFGGLGAAPPKSQPISAVIGTFVAHKVPACYTIGRTPQGIKESGCQIPRFQRISTLHDTESRFLAPWIHLV